MSEIYVYGITGERLSAACLQQLTGCVAVVVSKRFAPLLPADSPRKIAIAPVETMLAQVAESLKTGDVTVLASGDPLFFGIGRRLVDRFGPDSITFFPAVSAMQLACARFKLPWDDLPFLSLHGRNSEELAGSILPHRKVMFFTDHRNSPDRIATALLQILCQYGDERRQEKIHVQVAENLGTDGEKLTSGSLETIAGTRFGPLNMMLVEQDLPPADQPLFGLREQEIMHSRGLITKDEVRAVILHSLRLPACGVLWDVGGGSGSISLEAAGVAPGLSIYTIEKKQEGRDNIRKNIVRYNRWSIHLVSGEAPDVLAPLPDPDRIFIGGSGGRLPEIITDCTARLKAGGIMVASAVLASTAQLAPQLMRENRLAVRCTTLQVSRREDCGQTMRQLNPITLVIGRKILEDNDNG